MKYLLKNESGQAMAEYAIITFFVTVSMIGVFKVFTTALATYVYTTLSVLALPIP